MTAQFLIGILTREAPFDGAASAVAALLPSAELASQRGQVGHAAVQALASEDTDFDFRPVQPAGVLGGVMKLDSTQQAPGGRDAEYFFKAAAEVSVQIVHHKMDAMGAAIDALEQVAREAHKVGLGTPLSHQDAAPSGLGFDCYQQIAGAP